MQNANKPLSGKKLTAWEKGRDLLGEINKGVDQMLAGKRTPSRTVNVTSDVHAKRMAQARAKKITAKQFFALSEEEKKIFLFNIHLGFKQAWLDFGLDFPRKYHLAGAYAEYTKPNEIQDTYVPNSYIIGAHCLNSKNRYVEYGLWVSTGRGLLITCRAMSLPVQEHMLEYQGNVEAGYDLFTSWIKILSQATLPAVSLKQAVESAAIFDNICESEMLHILAETKCLSRQQFIRTWGELKRDYRSEQYALRGYHGPEAKKQAEFDQTVWALLGITPKQCEQKYKSLLTGIAWKR